MPQYHSVFCKKSLCQNKKHSAKPQRKNGKSAVLSFAVLWKRRSICPPDHQRRRGRGLHDQVERIISKYREKNGEPPEGMKALYEYLHRKQIEHAKAVKGYRDLKIKEETGNRCSATVSGFFGAEGGI